MLFEHFVQSINESEAMDEALMKIDLNDFYKDAVKAIDKWNPSDAIIEEYSKSKNYSDWKNVNKNFSVQPTYLRVSNFAVYYADSLVALDPDIHLRANNESSIRKNFIASLKTTNDLNIFNMTLEVLKPVFDSYSIPNINMTSTKSDLYRNFFSLIEELAEDMEYTKIYPLLNKYETEKYRFPALENFEKALENTNLDSKLRKKYQKYVEYLKNPDGSTWGRVRSRGSERAEDFIKNIENIQQNESFVDEAFNFSLSSNAKAATDVITAIEKNSKFLKESDMAEMLKVLSATLNKVGYLGLEDFKM